MKEIFELRSEIEDLTKKLNLIGDSLDPASLEKEVRELEQKTSSPDFWNDSATAQKIMADLAIKKEDLKDYQSLKNGISDNVDILDLVELSEDSEVETLEGVEASLRSLDKLSQKMKLKTQLSGEYDKNNAYLSINAGAGGLEATDWADMLFRMYCRYFDDQGFKYEIKDLNNEEAGGIKSVTIHVKGSYAYGYLKGEKGVHRLVRISPFDSQSRRHTSFASVDIFPELDDNIEIDIDPTDLRIDTYRASGAGGQHVNKTDSAVRITHIPTGVVATSQAERSQIQNKQTAMNLLMSKLVQIKEEEQREKIEDIQGKYSQIAWGSQIRSYVFQPYTMVKDHRTNYEMGNVDSVMDGNIQGFIDAYLASN
ncbi:peptide chain release factor 2 [uncultured Anaerococcus sp.]|uniref:peptide chain release factor 2 n=1 Tax=uncultured Anaerococcus sp. TaxID=293428 RepID=UPI0026397977|nr:peptide chain release factor 2 [uncultured Anaerococcus sp.]